MSVRSSILAVLTLGPAYGLQVHAEIESRTARSGAINVGQIYSTLTRLRTAGLVTSAEITDDGLPLYELTPDGRAEAALWLSEAGPTSTSEFAAMVQHVLLVGSLAAGNSATVIDGYRWAWRRLAGAHDAAGSVAGTGTAAVTDSNQVEHSLSALGESLIAEAALKWLEAVDRSSLTARPYESVRPKRGRRPN